MKNAWITTSEKTILKSPILEMLVRTCHSNEKNRDHDFYIMKSYDWSNIIPVTEDGKVVMIKQYRVGIEDFTLEVPGGVVDPEDPDNRSAAIRELAEETGYTPLENARTIDLGWAYPNPAIINNRCHSFAIGPVRHTGIQKLDPGEMIEVVEIPIEDIPRSILGGKVTHALMLNTFFLLALRTEAGSNTLIRELRGLMGR